MLPFRAVAVDGTVVCEAELLDHAVAGATAYFIATRIETRVLDPDDTEHFQIGIRPPAQPEAVTPVEAQPEPVVDTDPEVTTQHPADEEVSA